jgi:RNA polymerase sigma factor (sigma-70 family)
VSTEPLHGVLARIREGDDEASQHLVSAYEPPLRQIVRRSLPDRVRGQFDSDDVLQSVWVHVFRGLRTGNWEFTDEERLRAFLFTVARRRLVSRLRRHYPSAQLETPDTNLDTLAAPQGPRPSEVIQAEELWEQILELCPPEHHELLRLRRQGLTLEEIACRTGLHEGSVRRIIRGLARSLALRTEPLEPSHTGKE